MQKVVWNPDTGEQAIVDMTPEEQATEDARRAAAATERTAREQGEATEQTAIDAIIAALEAGTALTTAQRRQLDLYVARQARRA